MSIYVILLIVAILLLGAGVFYTLATGHHHNWEIVGAQKLNIVATIRGVVVDGCNLEPVTEVLERCTGCGDTKTHTLSGYWTLEQLLGR
jgi:hypothetical protein